MFLNLALQLSLLFLRFQRTMKSNLKTNKTRKVSITSHKLDQFFYTSISIALITPISSAWNGVNQYSYISEYSLVSWGTIYIAFCPKSNWRFHNTSLTKEALGGWISTLNFLRMKNMTLKMLKFSWLSYSRETPEMMKLLVIFQCTVLCLNPRA